MNSNDDDQTSLTTAKTLWSETIIEVLCVALRQSRPDTEVRELLREIREKNFTADYLIDKVRREVDDAAATRVRKLLQTRP